MAKKVVTDHNGYPCDPRDLDELSWFYEQREGLIICRQPRKGENAVTTTIPWRKLCAAVDRHRKIKGEHKR